MEVGIISARSLYASTSKVAGRAALVICGLATDVGHLHLAFFRGLGGTDLRVAINASLPNGSDVVAQHFVGGAAAHEALQVVARLREEAGVERALGGKTHARAGGAERLRDRGDDADLARAVDVAPALGDFTDVVGVNGLQRPDR